MAQTPNGKPRPISDQARDVYAERRRREALVAQAKAAATNLIPDWDQHPDLAESLISVWGSAREAVADVYDHDIPGAALNAGLAVTDALGGWEARSLLKVMAKQAMGQGSKIGLVRAAEPYAWKNARKRLGKDGYLEKGQHGHHWLIPQKGRLGEMVPEKIKNHPWNIMPMPNNKQGIQQHDLLHHGLGKKGSPDRVERYPPLKRYYYGTPTWAKAANVGAIGHPAGAAKAEWDRSSR